MKTELWLLRHGQSEGNLRSLRQGQRDYPLTDLGHRQISLLAQRWIETGVKFDHIIASPLTRALDSARLLADSLNVDLDIDERWQERNSGSAEGEPLDTLSVRNDPTQERNVYDPIFPGGESDLQLHVRAGEGLQAIMNRGPGRYLVVSHGGILNGAMHVILGLAPAGSSKLARFSFSNSGYAILQYVADPGYWRIEKLNVTNHLKPEADSAR